MKKIPKTITHQPKKAAEALTSPLNVHKKREENGVKYYEGVSYDPDGNPVMGDIVEQSKVQLRRAICDFAGAYPYLFDVIAYICTHIKAKEIVKDLDPNGFYYSITMTWEKFVDSS